MEPGSFSLHTLQKRGRYVNPHLRENSRKLKHFLLWISGHYKKAGKVNPIPEGFSYPAFQEALDPNLSMITWINHTTFLVEIEGKRFLTDPIWSPRCSPIRFLGPKRLYDAPIPLEELPHIDYIFISHNHYDHLDLYSVRSLQKRFPSITWIVPKGVKKWFIKKGITNVIELSWWQDAQICPTWKVTAVPAQHFSGRGAFDYNKTLWAGYVIEIQKTDGAKKTLYFAGDTGYNPQDFALIGKKFSNIDLSIIPIGAYLPREFMSSVHIDPKEAVQIHKEVGSKLSVSSHWKTFLLSDEETARPPYDLFLALQEQNLSPQQFRVLEPGRAINW